MIKDEDARRRTQVKQDMGDEFDGFDIDQVDKDQREFILRVLDKIRDRTSVIGGLIPAPIVFEILRLRKQTIQNSFTAFTVCEKLPQYIALAADDHLPASNIVQFYLFDREVKQNILGIITYNLDTQKMEWVTKEDKLVASATVAASDSKGVMQKVTFIARSQGKVIGSFGTKTWKHLPLLSLVSIHLPEKHLPPLEGHSFCFFGSQTKWTIRGGTSEGENKIAAISVREWAQPLGRIHDLDISTNHHDVHPALYLFHIVYNHSLERKLSIVRPIAKHILKQYGVDEAFERDQKRAKE